MDEVGSRELSGCSECEWIEARSLTLWESWQCAITERQNSAVREGQCGTVPRSLRQALLF